MYRTLFSRFSFPTRRGCAIIDVNDAVRPGILFPGGDLCLFDGAGPHRYGSAFLSVWRCGIQAGIVLRISLIALEALIPRVFAPVALGLTV